MKFKVDKKKFAEAFAAVSRFSEGRIKPILRNVHCQAEADGLQLSATNTEASATVKVAGADVSEVGVCLLDGSRVAPFLSLSVDSQFEVELTERTVTLRCGKSKLTLPIEDPSDFPLPKFEAADIGEFPAEALAIAFRRVAFAVDETSTRYALGGVALDRDGSTLTVVATDGGRLAVQPLGACKAPTAISIVPIKSIKLFLPLLVGRDPVTVKSSANDVVITSGNFCVASRLLEGRFPRWRDASKVDRGTARAATSAVTTAVRSAMLVNNEMSRGVQIELDGGSVFVTAGTADGKSESHFDLITQGPISRTYIDPRFLIEYLNAIGNVEAVSLSLNGERPCRVDVDDSGYCILMPLSTEK